MDNRIFNVNGSGKEMLLNTLKLAFYQKYEKTTAVGYILCPKKGMILLWVPDKYDKRYCSFPCPLTADLIIDQVFAWLQSGPQVEYDNSWDKNYDHDGHNSSGWRVYCEDWGHIDGKFEAICAIKPVFLWYGK